MTSSNVYESLAIKAGLWTGTGLREKDPELYRAVKRDVLGCSYSLGNKPNHTLLLANAQALIEKRKSEAHS